MIDQEPLLDMDDIQGHVLIGFGGKFQRLLGFRLGSGQSDRTRAVLLSWVEQVTTAAQALEVRRRRKRAVESGDGPVVSSDLQVAVSVSAPGLSRLQGSAAGAAVDPLFAEGAARGAAGLGDAVDETGRPKGWVVGDTPETTPDILFVLSGDTEEVVREGETRLLDDLQPLADVVYHEPAERLDGDIEHFGFVDGVSQPAVRGRIGADEPLAQRLYPDNHALAATYARPGQPLVWPGQFVFGYPTQKIDDPAPGTPIGEGDALLRNGSLLAFRRLRQDVSGFRRGMERLAQAFTDAGFAADADTVAAWCVGRWPDGTPVTLSPDGPDPAVSGDLIRRNGFLFDGTLASTPLANGEALFPGADNDPDGIRCPFFAHIRKVNPRDQVVDLGSSGVTLRSQMLRRGIPYGPRWSEQSDATDRGLLFMSYQTSIVHQFHRLMTVWVNNTFAPPPGEGIDPLIGISPNGGRPLTRRTDGVQSVRALLPGEWVTATGAGYFLAPGISALRNLLVHQSSLDLRLV